MQDVIVKHIIKNMPGSLKVNGTIYDDVKISDRYIDGTLLLRSQEIYIGNKENYFQHENNIDGPNFLAMWSLFIVKHLIFSWEKTKNEKYFHAAKAVVLKYIEAISSDDMIWSKIGGCHLNSTLILSYCYICLYKKNDEFGNALKSFLTEIQPKIIQLNDRMSYSMKASAITANLLLSILFCNGKEDIFIGQMRGVLKLYLYQDGTTSDNNISSNAYFNRFFEAFTDILKSVNKLDSDIEVLFDNNVNFLRRMTSTNGYFQGGDKSSFIPRIENYVHSNGKISVLRNEDIFYVSKYNEKDKTALSIYLECCGNLIISECGKIGEEVIRSGFSHKEWESKQGIVRDIVYDSYSVEVREKSSQYSTYAKYLFDNTLLQTQIEYRWENLQEGIRFFLPLASKIKDLCISDNQVKFYSSGVGVSIKLFESNSIDINLKSGQIREEGVWVQNKIIEIDFTQSCGNVAIVIELDKEELLHYKLQQEDFLPERAYRQVKSMISSNIMDQLVEYGNIGATEIYRMGRQAYLEHDYDTAKRCEILNSILHNCIIKSTCKISKGARLAYGGVGVLIHAKSVVGKYCMLGVGCSLAGGVTLGDYVYVSPGVRFTSNFHVGNFSIIGANAVVRKQVEPFSIMAGVPAKVIKRITPENIEEYLISYFAVVDRDNKEFVENVRQEFIQQYNQYIKSKKEEDI